MLDIIIVNWNTGRQLKEAVHSIYKHHDDLVSAIIIVDNHSTDDSVAALESLGNPSCDLRIIRNSENRGFAAACNQGSILARGEYLLFLNPDTALHERSLSVPLNYLEQKKNADIGIASIQLFDQSGRIARSCGRFPTLKIFLAHCLGANRLAPFIALNLFREEWAHDHTDTVDHVIGAFYLIRRSLFEALSGFDERFFVYFEDMDLSLRAHKAGWRSVFLADAQAFHSGGGSSRQVKAHRLFYWLRSRLFFAFKHFMPWQAWVLLGVTVAVEPISRTVFGLIRGGAEEVRRTLIGFGMLYRDLPGILRKVLGIPEVGDEARASVDRRLRTWRVGVE